MGGQRWWRVAAIAFAAVVTLSATPARADSVDDAKDLFARGREMRGRGDCAGAVVVFRKAYALYPAGLGSLRNLAECEESLERFASARRAWLDLKRALATTNDAKYDGWANDAEQAAARLAPRVATLTIDVIVSTTAGEHPLNDDSVDVLLNGEPIAPSLVRAPLDRDPGKYVVRAQGRRVAAPVEQSVDLAAGDAKRLSLRVVVAVEPSAAPSPTPSRREEPPQSPDTRRTLAWIAIGVGGASLVAGAVSLAVRQSALSDLNRACPNHANAPCDPSIASTVDRGKLASTLTTVFGAVGIAGVVTGAVLLVSAPTPSTRVGVVIAPQHAGVSARWVF